MRFRFHIPCLAAGILLAFGSAHAQPPGAKENPAKKQPAPLPEGVKVERGIPYLAGGNPKQTLDLYFPETHGNKPRPLIVWIHGGGWRSGSKAGCNMAGLVNEGYVVASVDYRFSQEAVFPAQIQDCQAAIRWLRAHAETYQIDPDRIGVWGGSAGGHLAALLGTAGGKNAFPPLGENGAQSDRVQAVVDVYGPADFNTLMTQAAEATDVRNIFAFNTPSDPYSSLIGVPLGTEKSKSDAVSPAHYISQDNPPFLIFHGTRDTLVPLAQSEQFAAALEKAGVNVTLEVIPGAGHGGPEFEAPAVKQLTREFFNQHLPGSKTAP